MGAAARRGGLGPEQEPVAEPAIAGPPLAVAAPTVAGRLLSLQRRAGNRAVLQLMRQPTAAARRGASISIVVERPMTPHEFAVRAFMQAFRMPGDVAEQRVSAYEAAVAGRRDSDRTSNTGSARTRLASR